MAVEIVFFKNRAEPKVVDKTDYLDEIFRATCVFKDEQSLTDPVILLEKSYYNSLEPAVPERPNFNYAYIRKLDRCYYVTNITSVRNDLWEISLHCDVLHTYRDSIKDCIGFIDRCEFDYDPMIVDKLRAVKNGVTITESEVYADIFGTEGSILITGFTIDAVDLQVG